MWPTRSSSSTGGGLLVDSNAEPQLRETLKALLRLLQELLSETRGLSNTVSSDYLVFLCCQAARGWSTATW